MELHLFVNGKEVTTSVPENRRALDFLRKDLGLKSVKEGCGEGECGACTILLDGKAVCSCLLFASDLAGRRVLTLESLGKEGHLHPIQQAFAETGAVQCGFCTPGIILSAVAAMRANPKITEKELWSEMDGNLCRCTGYEKIQAALRKVLAAHKAGEDRT